LQENNNYCPFLGQGIWHGLSSIGNASLDLTGYPENNLGGKGIAVISIGLQSLQDLLGLTPDKTWTRKTKDLKDGFN